MAFSSLAINVGVAFGCLVHCPQFIRGHKVWVLEQSLATEGTTKDANRIQNKPWANLDQGSGISLPGQFLGFVRLQSVGGLFLQNLVISNPNLNAGTMQ